MAISRLSPGYISCNELSETVLFAFERIQIVQGYSAINGELNWVTRIDVLRLTNIIETDEGGRTRLTYRTPKKDFMDIMKVTDEYVFTVSDDYIRRTINRLSFYE